MTAGDNDYLYRFVFERTSVRGELVHLDASWRAVLDRHAYPEPVRDLLGQAIVAATLLSATIKFEGALQLQLQGDGPVNLLLVEVTSGRAMRGLAHWSGEVPAASLGDQVGNARLAITIDPGEEGERYQGMIEVAGDSIAEVLERYFQQSEQLATRMWLAASAERASGMLLQRLPGVADEDEDWNRDVMLGETVTTAELLDLTVRELLHRLFHEEDLRLFEPEPVSFRCSCSRDRIETMLRGLGYDEMQDILAEQGEVSVNCEFCNQAYCYDAVDIERLFAAADQPAVPTTRH